MKKTAISTAVGVALAVGAVSAQALTLTLRDNVNPLAVFPGTAPNTDQFNGVQNLEGSAPNEFRVMSGGAVSGNGEKSIVDNTAPAMTWDFTGFGGTMTAVGGTDTVPSSNPSTKGGTNGLGISGPGLFLNAEFLFPGAFFGFLAPVGAAAANGPATISGTSANFTVHFPIMEAHWANGTFTIGRTNGGVDLTCTAGHCVGEQEIAVADDSLGFNNQFTQWEFDVVVSGGAPVPVPAAVWLFGSGLLGLVGVGRRKKAS